MAQVRPPPPLAISLSPHGCACSYLGVAATVVVVIVAVASPLQFVTSSEYVDEKRANDLHTEVVHKAINPGVVGAYDSFLVCYTPTHSLTHPQLFDLHVCVRSDGAVPERVPPHGATRAVGLGRLDRLHHRASHRPARHCGGLCR